MEEKRILRAYLSKRGVGNESRLWKLVFEGSQPSANLLRLAREEYETLDMRVRGAALSSVCRE